MNKFFQKLYNSDYFTFVIVLLFIGAATFTKVSQAVISDFITVIVLNIIYIVLLLILTFSYMHSVSYKAFSPRVKFGMWAGIIYLFIRICLLVLAIINEISIGYS